MKTGYFGKVRSYPKDKGYRFVSIARFAKFWDGNSYQKLGPPAEIIKIKDEKLYTKIYYEKVLSKLNPQQVFDELGDNAVCFVMKNMLISKTAQFFVTEELWQNGWKKIWV